MPANSSTTSGNSSYSSFDGDTSQLSPTATRYSLSPKTTQSPPHRASLHGGQTSLPHQRITLPSFLKGSREVDGIVRRRDREIKKNTVLFQLLKPKKKNAGHYSLSNLPPIFTRNFLNATTTSMSSLLLSHSQKPFASDIAKHSNFFII
ncbi:hypothetical protein L484_007272 [Morus notabilis]|uniref:Uncharacterized protein n=1 Tax=Morus notabilis TaxID=981085 RepID=W9QZ94_9ROSA|nr:hypothetical protein L484_007272 [Morus notabilis]